MPLFRSALVVVALAALVAGCTTNAPRESTSDVANNSTTETNSTTPILPGFNTTSGQGETPVALPPGP